jgi:hypothetical protein
MPRQTPNKETSESPTFNPPSEELNPADYEIPESIELSTRNKYAGKPKVRANASKPLIGSHGPKVSKPTFGTVRGEYN